MSEYKFSEWFMLQGLTTKNEDDSDLTNIDISKTGIYIIAYSKNKKIAGKKFELKENGYEIIYIGKAASQSLHTRLKQFIGTLKDGNKPQHGGADRVKSEHQDIKNMYVSICSFGDVDKDENNADKWEEKGKIAKLEYDYFAKYIRIKKELPLGNREKSRKYSVRK